MTDIEDMDCNTCHYYDPVTGVCFIDKQEHAPYEDPCKKWVDWEEHDER